MNDIDPTNASTGISQEEKQWGMFAHLSALLGLVIPLGNVIGPLVIWLVKKDTMPFVDNQAKEALNFQITVIIAMAGMLFTGDRTFESMGIATMTVVAVAMIGSGDETRRDQMAFDHFPDRRQQRWDIAPAHPLAAARIEHRLQLLDHEADIAAAPEHRADHAGQRHGPGVMLHIL